MLHSPPASTSSPAHVGLLERSEESMATGWIQAVASSGREILCSRGKSSPDDVVVLLRPDAGLRRHSSVCPSSARDDGAPPRVRPPPGIQRPRLPSSSVRHSSGHGAAASSEIQRRAGAGKEQGTCPTDCWPPSSPSRHRNSKEGCGLGPPQRREDLLRDGAGSR
jgi:hypothetical protein